MFRASPRPVAYREYKHHESPWAVVFRNAWVEVAWDIGKQKKRGVGPQGQQGKVRNVDGWHKRPDPVDMRDIGSDKGQQVDCRRR
jgi:hypothetical protein